MKPQDLFIGIRDFLALLVPGCVLLLLWPVPVVPWLLTRSELGTADSTLRIFVLLIAALAIGTILSGISGLMDYGVDAVVGRDFEKPVLKKGIRSWIIDEIRSLQSLESRAENLELDVNRSFLCLKREERPWTTRSFWWNYLRLNCPAAIAELDRIEGLQKQFRSLVVVALILAAFAFVRTERVGTNKNPNWNFDMVNLQDPAPWLNFLGAMLAASVCLVAYAQYRVTFSRRLFQLAIIHAIPKNAAEDGFRRLFANRAEQSDAG